MRTTKAMIGLLLAAICLVACGGEDGNGGEAATPETPAQAIEAIIQLIEAKDYDAMVRTRYAEIAKAPGEEQILILIDRTRQRFEQDDQGASMIANFREAQGQTDASTTSEDKVELTISAGTIRLSRMPNGKWGFHM